MIVLDIEGELLIGPEVDGPALRLDTPLSLWGGFDVATGRIVERRHPQYGRLLTGAIVLMSAGWGSSSSSSVLLEASRLDTAPAALVLERADPILAVGAAAAAELYGRGPSVMRVASLPAVVDGRMVRLRRVVTA